MEINLKDRKFLQTLREHAREEANIKGLSSDWKRLYLQVVDVMNALDAFRVRIQGEKLK